jgi:hypothetical protein
MNKVNNNLILIFEYMEKIVLKIKDTSKLSFFLKLLNQLDFVEVDQTSIKKKSTTKNYDFFASAGLSKNRDINADELRKNAWKRIR